MTQLLDPDWVAGAARASPSDWTPCPYYSHFWWRKPLNSGAFIGRKGAPVPADTYYAFGGVILTIIAGIWVALFQDCPQ